MLNSIPTTVAVGILLGFLSGLGIGGGSLLIIWLTVMIGMDPLTARSINLLFFIPSALISCGLRIWHSDLRIRPLIPAIIGGCAASAVFSWISTIVDILVIKKLFGVILIGTGIRELLYRPRNAR